MTVVRLEPPAKAPVAPALDSHQAAVVEHLRQGATGAAVLGEAGSGKTTLAVALAAAAATELALPPERVLVLAATRIGAAQLRDRVSAAMGVPTGAPTVRTVASAAFAVLRARAGADGQPAPVLVSGADQDAVLRDLLAGHSRGEGAAPDWADVVPPEATRLAGFRAELRDLIMRAVEANWGPDRLRAEGERWGRPEWVAAASVYQEYEQVMELATGPADQGARYDPAGVVAAAADLLRSWPGASAPSWDVVVVDDAHDATVAGWDLMAVMAGAGARVFALGSADEAVQGYRGAVPSRLSDASAAAPAGLGLERFELGGSHRQEGTLLAGARLIAARVPVIGGATSRPRTDVAGDGSVALIEAASRHAEARAIAVELRRARAGSGGDPVPWSQLAVIAPSGADVRALRSALAAMDVPCASAADGAALRDEPAVAALLTMLRLATGAEWTPELAHRVLISRAVGLDALGVRRLRRALSREEREAGGTRPASELIVDAMGAPERLATLRGPEAARAALAARAVADGAAVAARPGATPGAVLWSMWARLGVAEAWRDAALAGSTRDDIDLDAVIALMRVAQQYGERLRAGAVTAFADYVESQEFAADSLAARGSADGVVFATPAAAAGREWDTVVIAGVEEGGWPNLRLRGSVLGAPMLQDLVVGRVTDASPQGSSSAAYLAGAREAVLADETRAFHVALTRARRRTVVTFVSDDELQPSRYAAWLRAGLDVEAVTADQVGGVSDLRDAVAALRRDAGADPTGAALLARLAAAGVAGADPSSWYGAVAPTTDEPLWRDGEQVRVSPSKVEAVETCSLKWALEYSGGSREAAEAQMLGTLIHAIAEQHPRGTAQELHAALDARWHEMEAPANWIGRALRQRADRIVDHLAGYIAGVGADDVRTEETMRVEIGRALLSGSVDRLHVTGDLAEIVDLKTGKAAVSEAEGAEHAQLAMYQLAAERGAFEGVTRATGAELVYIGTANKSASIRRQDHVDAGAAEQRLGDVVDAMAGRSFHATTGVHCKHCPVRRSCPAQPEGGQVATRWGDGEAAP